MCFLLIHYIEHNKIFFVSFQVNGRDVSNLAHEEAVNEFLNAPEPILVEVRRRLNDEPIVKTPSVENKSEFCEPVEPIAEKPAASDNGSTELVKNVELENGSKKDLVSIGIQTEQLPFDNELIFNESPISDQDHPCNGFNECLTPAIDIEVRKIVIFESFLINWLVSKIFL